MSRNPRRTCALTNWCAALALAGALAAGVLEFLRLQGWLLRSRVLR